MRGVFLIVISKFLENKKLKLPKKFKLENFIIQNKTN